MHMSYSTKCASTMHMFEALDVARAANRCFHMLISMRNPSSQALIEPMQTPMATARYCTHLEDVHVDLELPAIRLPIWETTTTSRTVVVAHVNHDRMRNSSQQFLPSKDFRVWTGLEPCSDQRLPPGTTPSLPCRA